MPITREASVFSGVIQRLCPIITNGSRSDLFPALQCIEAIGPDAHGAVECVMHHLASDDDAVVEQAADTLGGIGVASSAAVDQLAEILLRNRRRSGFIREAIAATLQDIGTEKAWIAIQAAKDVYRDDIILSPWLHSRPQHVGDPRPRRPLLRTGWGFSDVPSAVFATIVQDLLEIAETIKSDRRSDRTVRTITCFEALGKNSISAIPILREHLKDNRPRVKKAAQRAVRMIKPDELNVFFKPG